ncbi:unnamed protein product [Amoebophrya sp. A120]|nr:unnamed protein product [Amoebophrya sp. A120]|eukprot:GSA120T00006818001.1
MPPKKMKKAKIPDFDLDLDLGDDYEDEENPENADENPQELQDELEPDFAPQPKAKMRKMNKKNEGGTTSINQNVENNVEENNAVEEEPLVENLGLQLNDEDFDFYDVDDEVILGEDGEPVKVKPKKPVLLNKEPSGASAKAKPKPKRKMKRRKPAVKVGEAAEEDDRLKINICWFRRNLRVYHDNPALKAAMKACTTANPKPPKGDDSTSSDEEDQHLEAEFLDKNNNKNANAAVRASSAKLQKNTTTDENGNTVDEDGNIVKKNPRGRPRKQKDPRENDIPLLCLYTMTPYMIPKTMKQQRQQLQGTGIVNNQRVPDQNCPGNQWWNLLLASLREVQTNLREHGQELYITQQREVPVFTFLFDEFNVDTVFFEQDLEPYGLVRDESVTELAERRGIRMVSYASQMLYDVRDFFYEEKFDDNDEKENEAAQQSQLLAQTGGRQGAGKTSQSAASSASASKNDNNVIGSGAGAGGSSANMMNQNQQPSASSSSRPPQQLLDIPEPIVSGRGIKKGAAGVLGKQNSIVKDKIPQMRIAETVEDYAKVVRKKLGQHPEDPVRFVDDYNHFERHLEQERRKVAEKTPNAKAARVLKFDEKCKKEFMYALHIEKSVRMPPKICTQYDYDEQDDRLANPFNVVPEHNVFFHMCTTHIPDLIEMNLHKDKTLISDHDKATGRIVKYFGYFHDKLGEKHALQRLEQITKNDPGIALRYDMDRTAPIVRDAQWHFYPPTTGLSPYLAMGNLSAKTVYFEVKKMMLECYAHCMLKNSEQELKLLFTDFNRADAENKVKERKIFYANEPKKKITKKQEFFLDQNQLLQNLRHRDYCYALGFSIANFGGTWKNKLVRQINWGNSANIVRQWEMGRTGYPFIDACMAQLRSEGWLPAEFRRVVCCFLTYGDMYESWERGRDVFAKYAIDNDWALNTAGWITGSCSCFEENFMNVYNPADYSKDIDPNGDYIRYYLPELRNLPADYIFEPWKMKPEQQEEFGCVLGRQYPARLLDHELVGLSNFNISSASDFGPSGEFRDPNAWLLRDEARQYVFYQLHSPKAGHGYLGKNNVVITEEAMEDAANKDGAPTRRKRPTKREWEENDIIFPRRKDQTSKAEVNERRRKQGKISLGGSPVPGNEGAIRIDLRNHVSRNINKDERKLFGQPIKGLDESDYDDMSSAAAPAPKKRKKMEEDDEGVSPGAQKRAEDEEMYQEHDSAAMKLFWMKKRKQLLLGRALTAQELQALIFESIKEDKTKGKKKKGKEAEEFEALEGYEHVDDENEDVADKFPSMFPPELNPETEKELRKQAGMEKSKSKSKTKGNKSSKAAGGMESSASASGVDLLNKKEKSHTSQIGKKGKPLPDRPMFEIHDDGITEKEPPKIKQLRKKDGELKINPEDPTTYDTYISGKGLVIKSVGEHDEDFYKHEKRDIFEKAFGANAIEKDYTPRSSLSGTGSRQLTPRQKGKLTPRGDKDLKTFRKSLVEEFGDENGKLNIKEEEMISPEAHSKARELLGLTFHGKGHQGRKKAEEKKIGRQMHFDMLQAAEQMRQQQLEEQEKKEKNIKAETSKMKSRAGGEKEGDVGKNDKEKQAAKGGPLAASSSSKAKAGKVVDDNKAGKKTSSSSSSSAAASSTAAGAAGNKQAKDKGNKEPQGAGPVAAKNSSSSTSNVLDGKKKNETTTKARSVTFVDHELDAPSSPKSKSKPDITKAKTTTGGAGASTSAATANVGSSKGKTTTGAKKKK